MSYFTKRSKRIVAGTLAGALALSVSPILGITGIASAADALPPIADPIGDGNFCEDAPTTEPFTDVSATDPSLDEIICLVATELTKGTTATTYSPNASITRRQMALFIKRTADLANELDAGTNITALPAYDGTTAPFTDIEGESAEAQAAIGQLNAAGIVQGTTASTYSPGANVSRRQMAAFINRLQDFLTGDPFTTTGDFFDDDEGDSGEANLNAVASVGIFQGDGAGNVFPGADLTRRQMANVLLRYLQVIFEDGDIRRAFAENDSATSRPELTAAKIVKTVTAVQVTPTNPIGTYVEYTFDEGVALFASAPAMFHLYNLDGSLANETGAVEASRSGSTVVIRFPALDTAAEAAPLTLATVDSDAVTDDQGVKNPEGDAALGGGTSGGSANLAAGITNAPDLVSVGGFRPGDELGETAVDFTYDEVAFDDGGSFQLVLTDGTVVSCVGPGDPNATPSGGSIAGGNGTTVLTVICPNPGGTIPTVNGTPLTATNVSRGLSAGVSEKSGPNNATDDQEETIQTVDVSNAGNTPDPDLVSAEFRAADATKDQILFTFDEEIATAGILVVYHQNDPAGTIEVGTNPVINAANKTQVLADFTEGALNGAVGVWAFGATAVDNGAAGYLDELGVANTLTTPANTAGNTAAPQLVSVTLAAPLDPFNNPGPFQATYTFDEPVEGDVEAEFFLYSADGTRYVATACTTGLLATPADVTDDANVICTAFDNAATLVDATSAQVGATKLGTVDDGAVNEKGAGTLENPEGAAFTTGGTP